VAIQDASGNTVPTANFPVTLALGANPGNTTLPGALTVNAVNGVATFSNLMLDTVGTGYTLQAASTSGIVDAIALTGTTSNAFNIVAGPPAQLAFTVQPGNTVAGVPMSVQVTIQDVGGNTVLTATSPITLALGANPPAMPRWAVR
jgi:hypothetical protein